MDRRQAPDLSSLDLSHGLFGVMEQLVSREAEQSTDFDKEFVYQLLPLVRKAIEADSHDALFAGCKVMLLFLAACAPNVQEFQKAVQQLGQDSWTAGRLLNFVIKNLEERKK